MLDYYDQLATDLNLPTSKEFVECSYCEEPVAPADIVLAANYPDEAFCSVKCADNWDLIQVQYEEVDYE